MGSKRMVGNGSGWNSYGHDYKHANTGNAADSFGFYAGPHGYVTLQVGEHIDACTKGEKKAINSGINAAGWLADTLADLRLHATGAVIEIDRNFTREDGTRVIARFKRVA